MRLVFALVAAWSGIAGCVWVEDVELVLRLPAGESPVARYQIELWRGGSCPTAEAVFNGSGSGGTLIDRKDVTADALGSFPSVDEGDFVMFALGRDGECQPAQFGCTSFRAGSGEPVVIELGATSPVSDPCPSGMLCEAGVCVPDSRMCVELELETPAECTIPANCGPSYAFTCTDNTCAQEPASESEIALDITGGLVAGVVGERFTLTEQQNEFVHVLAPIVPVAGGPSSLSVWTAPVGALDSGSVRSPPASWGLDRPFAVTARDRGGTVHVTVFDQEVDATVKIGEIEGLTIDETLVGAVTGLTVRSGIPAFTGGPMELRQFWYGEGHEVEGSRPRELTSRSRGGAGNTILRFFSEELPDFGARNEIIGSRGDFALMPTRTADTFFVVHSHPEFKGSEPEGEPIPSVPETIVLAGIGEERPAFVRLGDETSDDFALFYPSERGLVRRRASCPGETCTFDTTNPEPLAMGRGATLLRAEALLDGPLFVGVALAYMIRACNGADQIELLLLDDELRPVYRDPAGFTFAEDVELAVVHVEGGGWRVYVAWLAEHSERNRDVFLRAYDF